jgi:hypothetical protein
MSSQSRSRLTLLVGMLTCTALLAGLRAADDAKPAAGKAGGAKDQAAVKPKPLSDHVKKGLAYLASQQHADGGWGQGGGWRVADQGGRVEGPNLEDPSDVANTCLATLALLRAGNTPKTGPYANNVANAVEFICGHVARADKDSLYVTGVRGTQAQSKIGPFVDTFLAALVLAEIKGEMPDEKGEKKLVASLQKTVAKIEKHQKADGTFAGNTGWAPVFSQGLASKGLNRASQKGIVFQDQTLARASENAVSSVDLKSRTIITTASVDLEHAAALRPASAPSLVTAGVAGRARDGLGGRGGAVPTIASGAAPTDAGVRLYSFSNQTAALQEAANTGKVQERLAREILASNTASQQQKDKAKDDLGRIAKVEEARKVAVGAVVAQLGDKQFVQGFGSNGGEEFLSYLNISETLAVQGGKDWEKWDKSMTDNLTRIQNQDGSWSGDHCITGRTFCTASALLVLMADRTPIPVAAKLQGKK